MHTLMQDVRYAVRLLARNPGFAAVAIVTLALGIGATTAIFSFVNGVVLRPFAFRDSDRLVMLLTQSRRASPFPMRAVFPGDFLDWQRENRVFDSMAAFQGATFSVTTGGDPERLLGAMVTRDFFETMGVEPIAGRTFRSRSGEADPSDTVVIGERVWRRRFNANPALVGQRVTLDGRPLTLIGVMPAGFTFPRDGMVATGARPAQDVGIWTPLDLRPGDRSNATMQVIARIKPDVTLDQAQAEMDNVARAIEQQVGRRGFDVRIVGLRDDVSHQVRPLLFVLLGAVGFLLLIACTNVANLLLGRAAARQREVAIRAALGSGRWRLVRQFLTESVVLAVMGGLAGLLVAVWSIDVAIRLIPRGTLPRISEVQLDSQAFAFTMVVSIATGLLFGLAPAFQSSKADVMTALKSAGNAQTTRSRFFNVLVVAEVALAFVLLAGAGLLAKSFLRLTSVDPGFRPDSILTVGVTLPEGSYPGAVEMRRFSASAIERLHAVPGVAYAGAINWLPLGGNFLSGDFVVEDVPQLPRGLTVGKPAVSAEYFHAMGIPVLRGRTFVDRDDAEAPSVVIVTDTLARRLWPGQDALGKRIRVGFVRPNEPWSTVVGVVGEVKQMALSDETRPAIYMPLSQAPRSFLLRNLNFVVRTDGDPASAAAAIRRQIRTVDSDLPFDRVDTMRQVLSDSVSEPRFRSVVFGSFAIVALVLVAIGILGVLAHSVTRRTREIGVRMALGAQRVDVLRLVVRQALAMTIAGVALGAIGAAALTRLLASFLFDVRPLDPATFAVAAALLVGVALVASYVPARRASSVDPVIALRSE
ncbi:MAG TPA: ABC transporter permease [Vicinamibacterales bacterium]|nr:ABC transporter permease [Vicinamibacterales bacterium]